MLLAHAMGKNAHVNAAFFHKQSGESCGRIIVFSVEHFCVNYGNYFAIINVIPVGPKSKVVIITILE